jgi:hypothetical protein
LSHTATFFVVANRPKTRYHCGVPVIRRERLRGRIDRDLSELASTLNHLKSSNQDIDQDGGWPEVRLVGSNADFIQIPRER